MRTLGLIWLLLLLALTGRAQAPRGTWYLVHRSGLVELTIGTDSIRSRRLFPDLTPKDEPATATAYDQILPLPDRQLLVARSPRGAGYGAMTLFHVVPGRYLQVAWNAPDTTAATPAALARLHAQDHRELFGYFYFHQQYLDTLRQRKPIEAMTRVDYDRFTAHYQRRLAESIEAFRPYNVGYVAATYNFELAVQTLFELGYNPLQNISTVEALLGRFHEEKPPPAKKKRERREQRKRALRNN